MLNPAHTLVINWDQDGNIEYRDLVTGLEGQVSAGDVVTLRGSGGRTVTIHNDFSIDPPADASAPDDAPRQDPDRVGDE